MKFKPNKRSLTLNPHRMKNNVREARAILVDSASILSSVGKTNVKAARELLNELNGLNFARQRNRKLTKAEIVAVYSKNS